MTIDEYLEIERQRGNILLGGGYVACTYHLDGLDSSSGGHRKRLPHRQRNSRWPPKWMAHVKVKRRQKS